MILILRKSNRPCHRRRGWRSALDDPFLAIINNRRGSRLYCFDEISIVRIGRQLSIGIGGRDGQNAGISGRIRVFGSRSIARCGDKLNSLFAGLPRSDLPTPNCFPCHRTDANRIIPQIDGYDDSVHEIVGRGALVS